MSVCLSVRLSLSLLFLLISFFSLSSLSSLFSLSSLLSLLPRRLSNFKTIGLFNLPISWLQDLNTSMKRSPLLFPVKRCEPPRFIPNSKSMDDGLLPNTTADIICNWGYRHFDGSRVASMLCNMYYEWEIPDNIYCIGRCM